MNCPKCSANMEKIVYHKIEVDRCSSCRGIWFDMLEEEHLKEIKGAEKLDIGDPAKDKPFDDKSNINCPVCKTSMIRMLDNSYRHFFWYESCKFCYGTFFDAGEFREYLKEENETIADLLRHLIGKSKV